jgi:hypothetical protein
VATLFLAEVGKVHSEASTLIRLALQTQVAAVEAGVLQMPAQAAAEAVELVGMLKQFLHLRQRPIHTLWALVAMVAQQEQAD